MSPRTLLMQTLRNLTGFCAAAKQVDIEEQMQRYGYVTCCATGERCAPNEIEMDHTPPFTFEAIVWLFLATRRLRVADIAIETGGSPRQKDWRIADQKIAEDFRSFHECIAAPSIKLTSRSFNRAQSSKHRIPEWVWSKMA